MSYVLCSTDRGHCDQVHVMACVGDEYRKKIVVVLKHKLKLSPITDVQWHRIGSYCKLSRKKKKFYLK